MKRSITAGSALMVGLALAAAGCVHVRQLIKLNHDGSGTLVETIRVLPRTMRLLKRSKPRGGAGQIALLSEPALQRRIKAFGGVTLVSTERKKLPDGSLELKTVMTFKDINQVRLRMVPTFRCTDPNRKGSLRLRYDRIVYYNWAKAYYKKDQLNIVADRPPSQRKYSSPAIVQEYRDITPAFRDMLRDFRFEIQIQAPDDIETFEDRRDMVRGMPIDKNIVTVYRAYGENVVANPELIRSFLMGEVAGRTNAYGGDWRRIERSLFNTLTPYGRDYYGMSVHFLKPYRVPKPGTKNK